MKLEYGTNENNKNEGDENKPEESDKASYTSCDSAAQETSKEAQQLNTPA